MTRISQKKGMTDMDRREFFMEGQAVLTTLSVGADMERRMIFLIGVVDEEMAYRFVTVLKIMDSTPGPIAIFLDTPGGEMYHGAAMYDAIRTAQNPVVIQGTGHVMSMGSILLQAATLRFLTPETRVMIHNASLGEEGHLQAVVSSVKDCEVVNERFAKILAERTKHSLETVKGWLAKETYLSAQEAVDLGLADAVCKNRFLPASYEEGVEELNKYLPDGLQFVPMDDEEAPPKPAPKKKRGRKAKKK